MLYFKAVSAYKSGRKEAAVDAMEKLCTIYPDAAVAEYYLKAMRRHADDPEREPEPELTYFYRVPQEERGKALPRARAAGEVPADGSRTVRGARRE